MGFFRYYAAIFLLASVARIVVGNSPYRWFGIFLFLGCVYLFYGTQVALLAVYAAIALAGVCVGCSSLLYFNGVYRRKVGDLSYATYLYGWPVRSLCALALPHRWFLADNDNCHSNNSGCGVAVLEIHRKTGAASKTPDSTVPVRGANANAAE